MVKTSPCSLRPLRLNPVAENQMLLAANVREIAKREKNRKVPGLSGFRPGLRGGEVEDLSSLIVTWRTLRTSYRSSNSNGEPLQLPGRPTAATEREARHRPHSPLPELSFARGICQASR